MNMPLALAIAATSFSIGGAVAVGCIVTHSAMPILGLWAMLIPGLMATKMV